MSKKIVLMILITLVGLSLASCSLAVDRIPSVTDPRDEIKNEPQLRGYVLSFTSDFEESVNIDLGLSTTNPFMIYEYRYMMGGSNVVEYIRGSAVHSTVSTHQLDNAKLVKLDTEIILGPKFVNSIMNVRRVVYDPIVDELFVQSYTYGNMLSSMNSGLKIEVKSEQKENGILNDSFEFEINVTFVDELLTVNVFEYDENNNFLKSTVYDADGSYDLDTLENTEYVIIEEEYMGLDENIYMKRTIHSRNDNYSNTFYFPLMFTTDLGYVENNKSIAINFT